MTRKNLFDESRTIGMVMYKNKNKINVQRDVVVPDLLLSLVHANSSDFVSFFLPILPLLCLSLFDNSSLSNHASFAVQQCNHFNISLVSFGDRNITKEDRSYK